MQIAAMFSIYQTCAGGYKFQGMNFGRLCGAMVGNAGKFG